MKTKYVNYLEITENEFNEQINYKIEQEIGKLYQAINSAICDIEQSLNTEKYLLIDKYDCLINVALKFAVKNYDKCNLEVVNLNDNIAKCLKEATVIQGLKAEAIKNEEYKIIEKKFKKIDENFGYIVLNRSGNDDDKFLFYNGIGYYMYRFTQFSEEERGLRQGNLIPVNRLDFSDAKSLFANYYIPYGICNNSAKDTTKKIVETLHSLYTEDYVTINECYDIEFNVDKLMADSAVGAQKDVSKNFVGNLVSIRNDCIQTKTIVSDIPIKEHESKLLKCEKARADIEEYDSKILTDPNRGHWDLWSENSDYYKAEFNGNFFARNPLEDIKENGVIAIDFGTKSTVVVFQSEINQSLPMGIGDGNISKEVTAKRYENPTVMHFVDIANFLKAYNEADGRPNTKWNDITISHTAVDQFKISNSGDYYQYLSQIKQWAGERKKQFRIKQKDGTSIVLPAFTDLTEDDFNPIEIYAYYIGLYINNMRNGIFLDYYLSWCC